MDPGPAIRTFYEVRERESTVGCLKPEEAQLWFWDSVSGATIFFPCSCATFFPNPEPAGFFFSFSLGC